MSLLVSLGLSSEDGALTEAGRAFDDAWWVYREQATADSLWQGALMRQPETQALLQALHGREPVAVEGAVHVLARHGMADAAEPQAVRRFLQTLNAAGIV